MPWDNHPNRLAFYSIYKHKTGCTHSALLNIQSLMFVKRVSAYNFLLQYIIKHFFQIVSFKNYKCFKILKSLENFILSQFEFMEDKEPRIGTWPCIIFWSIMYGLLTEDLFKIETISPHYIRKITQILNVKFFKFFIISIKLPWCYFSIGRVGLSLLEKRANSFPKICANRGVYCILKKEVRVIVQCSWSHSIFP